MADSWRPSTTRGIIGEKRSRESEQLYSFGKSYVPYCGPAKKSFNNPKNYEQTSAPHRNFDSLNYLNSNDYSLIEGWKEQITKTVETLNSKTLMLEQKFEKLNDKFKVINETCNRLEAENLRLKEKIENSVIMPGTSQTADVIVPTEPPGNFVSDSTLNNVIEPSWELIEKEKCIELFEKSQNQMTQFLSLLLPELYNSAELISPTFFPETEAKSKEVKTIVNFFWKNSIDPQFYEEAIEKEFRYQRYKISRKIYHFLKAKELCIMRMNGKIYDSEKCHVENVKLSNEEETIEWQIPKEIASDPYFIGAKKDSFSTKIYKLELNPAIMVRIYTKQK